MFCKNDYPGQETRLGQPYYVFVTPAAVEVSARGRVRATPLNDFFQFANPFTLEWDAPAALSHAMSNSSLPAFVCLNTARATARKGWVSRREQEGSRQSDTFRKDSMSVWWRLFERLFHVR